MLGNNERISRRNFLKKGLIGLGGISVIPYINERNYLLEEFPDSEYIGRNTVIKPYTLPIRTKPSPDADQIRVLDEDECVPWLREVVGEAPTGRPNRKWVETTEGYIYSPSLQKVKNIPNEPTTEIPQTGEDPGMWVEVTVPKVSLTLISSQPQSPWLQNVSTNLWALYYSQIMWASEVAVDEDGTIVYHVAELYGTYGDEFWADARAFRVVTEEDLAPINPEATNKSILVNNNQQDLICYEGNNEVYYCQVSTGMKLNSLGEPVDNWATPTGSHWIWRKSISTHMSGGNASGSTEQGYDTIAIPWSSIFVGSGAAIHGAFWHNDFGTPKSHGCVNTNAEDAKWIFRWTTPQVPYNPGDISDTENYSGTVVKVIEPLY